MRTLVQLASTGAFVALIAGLATRGWRRARKGDQQRRLTDVEYVVALNHERLTRIERHLGLPSPDDQPAAEPRVRALWN